MSIHLLESAFRRGVGDVDLAVDRLRHDRDQVGRRVEALLDGGWAGEGATAFGAVWAEWLDAARDVVDGLSTMGELLRAAEAGLHAGDAASAARLDAVAADVVRRLGG